MQSHHIANKPICSCTRKTIKYDTFPIYQIMIRNLLFNVKWIDFFLLCLTLFSLVTLTWKVSFFCFSPFFFLYTKRRPMCAQGKAFSLSDRGLRPYCIVHIIAQSQSCFCNACSSRSSAAVSIVATISLMQTGFCLPNGPLPFARFAMN